MTVTDTDRSLLAAQLARARRAYANATLTDRAVWPGITLRAEAAAHIRMQDARGVLHRAEQAAAAAEGFPYLPGTTIGRCVVCGRFFDATAFDGIAATCDVHGDVCNQGSCRGVVPDGCCPGGEYEPAHDRMPAAYEGDVR